MYAGKSTPLFFLGMQDTLTGSERSKRILVKFKDEVKVKAKAKEVCELGERAVQSIQLGRVRFIDINLSRVTIVISSTRLTRAVEASKACL